MHKVVHPDKAEVITYKYKCEDGTELNASKLLIDGVPYDYAEVCPECEQEIPVLMDPEEHDNYEVTCPVCGRKLLLCTICQDDCYGICDWCDGKCYRNRR